MFDIKKVMPVDSEWSSSNQGTPIGLNDWIVRQEHKLGVLVYTDEEFQNIMRLVE